MSNQISKGHDFSTGDLVTATNLDDLADKATLLKGAISQQPNLAATLSGTYNYTSGTVLTISSPSHGLLAGDKVKIDFTSTSGASGNLLDGIYTVNSPLPSPDTFNITLEQAYDSTAGTVSFNEVPAPEDEILVHDVSDVSETKPKRVSVSQLMSSSDVAQHNEIVVNAITGRTFSGITVEPIDGPVATGATYSSIDGLSVSVTKANHNLVIGDVIDITCTETSGNTGSAYSGVVAVETTPTPNTFTYYLRNEAFITLNEHTDTEVDQPLSSVGNATYKKVGTLDSLGNVVVRSDVFVNGTMYMRGDTFTYGRAKFGEFVLPKGRSLSRPANPEEGQLFYNRDDDVVEIFRKSIAYPSGTWETFDKVSNVIYIPASYSVRTPIQETAQTWYSKTLWTSTPIRFKQYEISLPPVRIQHFNNGDDGAVYGKLELIAKDASNADPNEYVIARFVSAAPNSVPFAGADETISVIPAWNAILTPDDIDMSNMNLTLRVSCWQQQGLDAAANMANPSINMFSDSTWILPWTGFVKITPITRKGGTPVPTPWKKEAQTNSLTNITTAQRLANAWWGRQDGVNLGWNTAPMANTYPQNLPAHIPMVVVRPFGYNYGNSISAGVTTSS